MSTRSQRKKQTDTINQVIELSKAATTVETTTVETTTVDKQSQNKRQKKNSMSPIVATKKVSTYVFILIFLLLFWVAEKLLLNLFDSTRLVKRKGNQI